MKMPLDLAIHIVLAENWEENWCNWCCEHVNKPNLNNLECGSNISKDSRCGTDSWQVKLRAVLKYKQNWWEQLEGMSRTRPRGNRACECTMWEDDFRTLQISTAIDGNSGKAFANILKSDVLRCTRLCNTLLSLSCLFCRQTSCCCHTHTQRIKCWTNANLLWRSTIRSICYVLGFAQMVLSHAEELELFHSTH